MPSRGGRAAPGLTTTPLEALPYVQWGHGSCRAGHTPVGPRGAPSCGHGGASVLLREWVEHPISPPPVSLQPVHELRLLPRQPALPRHQLCPRGHRLQLATKDLRLCSGRSPRSSPRRGGQGGVWAAPPAALRPLSLRPAWDSVTSAWPPGHRVYGGAVGAQRCGLVLGKSQ